ncbi:Putative serine protease HtrA [Fuerstiella marisgermanici]|uniref:Serine protease HtrA n=1 Tax=Fuerstiella marisgermanici TaxID=1891926 RepID=A0A1P8WSL0_9PLAN|nr:Putative serine protease HtrA [Fuerstiella marisgermanici]
MRCCLNCKILSCAFLTFAATFAGANSRADELSETVRAAVAEVTPSVVRIRIIGSPDAGELAVSSQVTTGVAISDAGDVLTSVFGLTSTPAAVFVEDSRGERVAAKIVARDHVRKLALLKCEAGTFQPARIADERWPKVGEWSIALGRLYPTPSASVSVGIVSATRRIHGLAIQTDAKISPVNYGGPLVNLDGLVTGILVPLSPSDSGDAIGAGVEWYDSGIGFAIPMADALEVAESLRDGKDRVRGVIGIRPSTRNPLETEVSVALVLPKSPAEEAGLLKGDRIVAANGQPVTRFGIFDSITKSSYAGDQMKITVKRGEQTIESELILAAEIERPVRGFLGILIGQPDDAKPDGAKPEDADAEDEAPDDAGPKSASGVPVFVLEGSPAAMAGLPESAVLTKWNDEGLDTPDTLLKQFQSAVADTEIQLEYQTTDGNSEPQTATIKLQPRPTQILNAPEAVVAGIIKPSTTQKWQRTEKQLKDVGKVWIFAPQEKTDDKYGVICLLSESTAPAEAVMSRWEATCRRHNLIIAVPVNSEQTELTREDEALVLATIGTFVREYNIDSRRLILAAEKPQALLCSELLLNPRLRQLRAAVFLDCWPQVSGLPRQLLAAKSPSVLFVDGGIQSRQAMALREQSFAALKEAGVWTVAEAVAPSGENKIEDRIATWALNIKAR